MLTHSNLLYQLNNLKHFLQPSPGESSLSLLNPWHIYERSCGYFIYSCGMKQVYTSIRRFREDLTKFPPQFFVCVPLVIDTLQTKVCTPDLHVLFFFTQERELQEGLLEELHIPGHLLLPDRCNISSLFAMRLVPRELEATAELWHIRLYCARLFCLRPCLCLYMATFVPEHVLLALSKERYVIRCKIVVHLI